MGSPPVTGSARRFKSSRISGSFFYRRAASAGVADPVRGPAVQVGVEFLTAAAAGIDMQARDEGHEGVAAVADLLGLQGGEPAALLLIEAAEQQVEAAVACPVRRVLVRGAAGALALMDLRVSPDNPSVGGRSRQPSLYGKLEVICRCPLGRR